MKLLRTLGRLLLIFLAVFLFTNNQQVKADTNEDFQNALNSTPKGLNWGNNAFVLADFTKAAQKRKLDGTNLGNKSNANVREHSSMINNAEIILSSPTSQNPDTSIIKMTNDKYQTGAVWSNMENDNYFDITKEQKASMWLYLGKINKSDMYTGDGMAFVLQNDPNGENAIALSADGIPVNGQSLGVWGADWNTSNHDPSNLSKTAIQNSWALEFDTFPNYNGSVSSGEGVSFDYQVPGIYWEGRHIAGNYPALSTTYSSAGDFPNTFYMNHEKPKIYPKLVDNHWHHVSITWEPINDTTGTLSYAYDDKDPGSGKPSGDGTVTKFTLDTTKFGLQGDQKKLYWGFTGSTGNYSENNLMVFESLPSFVDADAKAEVFDNSQGNSTQVLDQDTVDPNTDISYRYSLNYKGWTKTWDHINLVTDIPAHITFTSGTVTYPDSPVNKNPRPIPEDVFQNISKGEFQYLMPEQLDSHSRNAVIELHGKTEKTATSTLTVPSVHTAFEGDNLITGTETPSFKIRPKALSLDSSSSNPIKVGPHEDAVIPGQVSYVGTVNNPDYQNMVVHQSLNGTSTELKNIIDSNGNFNLTIDKDSLDKINSLSFYVTDSDGRVSNSIARQILKGGLVAFGPIQDKVAFKPTNGSFENQVVPRLDNWQISVIDSREIGSDWTVQAKSTDLINKSGNKLNGHLFYRDDSGKDSDLRNNVNVASHTKDIESTQTSNITDKWKSNSGVLLFMNKGNLASEYNGSISWTLIDSITNK